MKPIHGITQIVSAGNCSNPFTLGSHQSCTLNLLVNGDTLSTHVKGGPVVCDQGNVLECYQPAAANCLTISLVPVTYYLITPVAGADGVLSGLH